MGNDSSSPTTEVVVAALEQKQPPLTMATAESSVSSKETTTAMTASRTETTTTTTCPPGGVVSSCLNDPASTAKVLRYTVGSSTHPSSPSPSSLLFSTTASSTAAAAGGCAGAMMLSSVSSSSSASTEEAANNNNNNTGSPASTSSQQRGYSSSYHSSTSSSFSPDEQESLRCSNSSNNNKLKSNDEVSDSDSSSMDCEKEDIVTFAGAGASAATLGAAACSTASSTATTTHNSSNKRGYSASFSSQPDDGEELVPSPCSNNDNNHNNKKLKSSDDDNDDDDSSDIVTFTSATATMMALKAPPPPPSPQQQQPKAAAAATATAPTRTVAEELVIESHENEVPSNMIRRRGSRQRTSTVIYVNGDAVKKQNNYRPNAVTYEYGQHDDEGKKKKPNNNKARSAPKKMNPAVVPRVATQLQVQRWANKNDISQRIAHKARRRREVLQQHVHVLSPFVADKVLQNLLLQQDSSTATTTSTATITTTTSTMSSSLNSLQQQPELITAGEMRDYQMDGLAWMANMYENNVGFILGDEMGLGKTLQTISLICHLKETHNVTGPSLVICPLSVLYSWCSEIAKWAPSLKHLRFHSSSPESMEIPDLSTFDIIVTTYEMAKTQAMTRTWSRQHFNLLILDEGHRIKGMETQISKAVRRIHAETRAILTGTPLANNLVELYSLLSFLAPDVFTTVQPFEEAFNLSLNIIDPQKLMQANKLLDIFMIRRLKVEVEKLMPAKIETKVVCPLSNAQIWWYKAVLLKDISILARSSDDDDKELDSNKTKAGRLNNLLMQLRKVCLHPFLFPLAEDVDDDGEPTSTLESLVGSSGKLAVLDKLLRSLFVKQHRVCLFSQFTSVLDILQDYCDLRGWKYCRLDGSTSRAKRNFVINNFNAPDTDKFLFLMSTRSGGMGLNLQTADTCILFDSDWNPQPDIQAMARVHRIGQKKTVHVYRLVTNGTVEARMVERAEKKLYLDRMVTQDGAASSSSSQDLEDDINCDGGKLMSTLRFGCDAVFGNDSENQSLPSDADIEIITDRSRTQDFSNGNLKGGAEQNAHDFDIAMNLRATTNFAGIDFKAIRDKHKKSKLPDNVNAIGDAWRKRQRKNRIIMVQSRGSGYGPGAVPVLAMNHYDLETGERSVFDQELDGRTKRSSSIKAKATFLNQDFCQVCGDGGDLIMCPRCPISAHAECLGLTRSGKGFQHCPHHYCANCEKTASRAGGFLFACSCCPNAYCEDCVPKEARMVEECLRMQELGYNIKNGSYIHCSAICENVAVTEFDWSPPTVSASRGTCPPPLDVIDFFGGKVDDNVDCPDELIVTGKRQRKAVTTYSPGETAASVAAAAVPAPAPVNVQHAAKPAHFVAAAVVTKVTRTQQSIIEIESSDSSDSLDQSPEYIVLDSSDSDNDDDDASQKPPAKTLRPSKQGVAVAPMVATRPKPAVAVTAAPLGHQPSVAKYSATRIPTVKLATRTSPTRTPPRKKDPPNDSLQPQPVGRQPSGYLRGYLWDATRGVWASPPPPPRHTTGTASSALLACRAPRDMEYCQYEVTLPVTSSGLMLALCTRYDGVVVFSGYRRHDDGRKGPAEVNNLVRSVGDEVVAVNGTVVTGQSLKRIIALLGQAKEKSPSGGVRVCFRTKEGY